MGEVLYLVKNGVPWSVAMELEPDVRFGMVVALTRFDPDVNSVFDWDAGKWSATQ